MENLTLTTFFGGASFPVAISAQTTNSTHIQIVFTQNMNISTAGWNFKKNGGALSLTSVAGTGTNTATLLVGVMAYGDIITYSYNSATGSTISSSTGLELQSVTDVSVINNVAPVIPTVVSANTTDTTHIALVFSEAMNATTVGWSFKINGGALTLTSLAGSGTTTITFLVGTMAAGDILTWTYDATTGNTVSTATGIEMASAADQAVTNNISSGASLAQTPTYDLLSGAGALAYGSPNTAGNTNVVWYFGNNGLFGATALSSNGNTYNTFHQQSAGFGLTLYGLYAKNINAGSETVTCAGISGSQSVILLEYNTINTTAPLLDDGGANGVASPLQDTLTFGANSLLTQIWWNQNVNDFTSLVAGTTQFLQIDNGFGAVFVVLAHNLSATAGSQAVGVNTGGNADNFEASGAFQLL